MVGGLTYSTTNPFLQYKNGIDAHIDWAASQFVSKNVLVGVAGYYFQQPPPTAVPGRLSARSGEARSASVRKSASSFPSATTSRAT
ncbi:transporter [Bradyrhizobium sp. BRP22]|uniref:transporter n=1 Tax=Bradyrhizobium sp. BRP22 TaxID=2793821 RepID=UPI0031FC58C8